MDSPDQLVDDYVSNLSKSTMDLSKPLWDFHVLNVETSEATSYGVFRFHHSLGDGVSLISTLLACTRKTSDPNALPSLPIAKKKLGRGNYLGFLRYFYALLLIFKLWWNTFVDVVMMMATMICLKDTKTPLKGAPGIEKSPKWFVRRMLNFHDIKLVKNAMGTTVNDVVLGVTQAGLTRYLNEKYGKDKGENRAFKNNLPKHVRLRALVAVNLRPTIMIEDILEMMEANSKCGKDWGNLFGSVYFPFHIALRDDPLDYIRDAKATMDRKKHSFQPWLSYFNTKLLLSMGGVKAAATSFYKALSNTTLGFSCLAGPIDEMSWSGHPVAFFAPSVYGVPQALVIHFQSYMDKMIVALAVDRNVIPDPYKLCDEIEKSLVLAKNCVIDRKLVKFEDVD
ncbi:hypothetical protein Cgig2_001891 [Carnegiea gigantea]|uniref:Diacylglycerol O-acyltransferase n=1 Tax=Carnegiea gigantea TaxID=171969 RepID=A0A9Q1JNL0_9CARY|nr:hypothetical protein Cgig2_001891 [Carnegiea gigantea]